MKRLLIIITAIGLSTVVVHAQDSGGDASQPDPIAIAVAHVLKGQTNAEQRKAIRKQWLIVAAQELEDVLRTKAFAEIISFVQQNRDLFVDIYTAMKQVKGSITLVQKAKEVVVLQGDLLVLFGESADLLSSCETLSEEELRMLITAIDDIITNTEDNFYLLTGAFAGLFNVHMADTEKLELLTTVHQRLSQNRTALLQLQRYVRFMDVNRKSQLNQSPYYLFKPAQ